MCPDAATCLLTYLSRCSDMSTHILVQMQRHVYSQWPGFDSTIYHMRGVYANKYIIVADCWGVINYKNCWQWKGKMSCWNITCIFYLESISVFLRNYLFLWTINNVHSSTRQCELSHGQDSNRNNTFIISARHFTFPLSAVFIIYYPSTICNDDIFVSIHTSHVVDRGIKSWSCQTRL
jgi:hypothetical protein